MLPTAQRTYADQQCAAGTRLDYRAYEGRDHVPLVEADSPAILDLIRWTRDRLAGTDAPTTCT